MNVGPILLTLSPKFGKHCRSIVVLYRDANKPSAQLPTDSCAAGIPRDHTNCCPVCALTGPIGVPMSPLVQVDAGGRCTPGRTSPRTPVGCCTAGISYHLQLLSRDAYTGWNAVSTSNMGSTRYASKHLHHSCSCPQTLPLLSLVMCLLVCTDEYCIG